MLADKCVGCGLCQTRCNLINVKAKGLLKQTAILVEAGPGRTSSRTDSLHARKRTVRFLARKRENELSGFSR